MTKQQWMIFAMVGLVFVGCEVGEDPPTAPEMVEPASAMPPTPTSTPTPTNFYQFEFDAELFAREKGEDAERWSWPAEQDFKATWKLSDEQEAIRVAVGTVRFEPDDLESCTSHSERGVDDVLVGVVERDGKAFLEAVFARDYDDLDILKSFIRRDHTIEVSLDDATADRPASYRQDCGRVVIEPRALSPEQSVETRHWNEWVYSTTLLTAGPPTHDEPRRDAPFLESEEWTLEHKLRPGMPKIKTLVDGEWVAPEYDTDYTEEIEFVRELMKRELNAGDRYLGRAAYLMVEAGEDELALELFRQYHPVGRCSRDSRPQKVAGDYASLCARLGDVNCYLQLRTRLLANQFPRLAWSSYGELAHRSGSAKLVEAPIDVERFLAGLLLRYSQTPDQSREIGARNTARAISQGGFGDDLGWLQRMAEDDDLDGFNRLQATQVLYYLSLGEISEEAARIIEDLDATQVSREWMAIMASPKDLNEY